MNLARTIAASVAILAAIFCGRLWSATEGSQTKPAKSVEVPDLKMTLIRLEPGEFEMGSPGDEPNHQNNEFQHKVRLTNAFYIQTTPVTQTQYTAVMGKNPSYFHGDNLPVE